MKMRSRFFRAAAKAKKFRELPRKNQRRKRSTNALVRFTAPKSFRSQNPNFNPGGEFDFSSRFFCDSGYIGNREREPSPGASRTVSRPDSQDTSDLCPPRPRAKD